jgi:broad specificity phosphatase PhoE
MANVYLIRHGQASWGKSNYDQLSELGSQQGRILGQHWQYFDKPDVCYAGGMLRHSQTADAFWKGAGQTMPVNIHEGLNEFDHLDVLKCYNPDWHNQTAFGAFLKEQAYPNKAFVTEFSQALRRWSSGSFDNYQESFQGFKKRCVKALEDIKTQVEMTEQLTAEKHSKNILVFTSGGVISSICAHYWQLPDHQLMLINQQIVNTSVTKLMFNKDKVSVDMINNYSHLQMHDDKYVTRK